MSDDKPVNLVFNPKREDVFEKAFTQGVGFMQIGNEDGIKFFDIDEIYKAQEVDKE